MLNITVFYKYNSGSKVIKIAGILTVPILFAYGSVAMHAEDKVGDLSVMVWVHLHKDTTQDTIYLNHSGLISSSGYTVRFSGLHYL